MANTTIPVELSSTPGIIDNSNATAITIDSSENVGIGVTPTAKLHVAGTIQSQTGSSVAQMYSDGGAAFFASVGAFPSVFTTNGTERLRIDSSGNVGIGTSSPVAQLTVTDSNDTFPTLSGATKAVFASDNTTNFAAGISIVGNATGSSAVNFGDYDNEDAGKITYYHQQNFMSFDTNAAERLRIDSSGNVGIGTSNPLVQLHLSKAGGTLIKLGTSQNSCEIEAREVGSGNSLVFSSNNSVDHLVIDSSGNVLVGTTNLANIAGHTPNVVTDLQFGCNDGSYISSFGIDRIHFNVGNFYVVNQGSTGVKLVNGATSWTTQSDENSKENIVELSGALTAVNAMRCVRYNLKSQTSDDVKIGFIAQDWQSSYPEVVATDTDGTLGMNYTETIPVLLKAIQEQQTIIESLTARITTLEG